MGLGQNSNLCRGPGPKTLTPSAQAKRGCLVWTQSELHITNHGDEAPKKFKSTDRHILSLLGRNSIRKFSQFLQRLWPLHPPFPSSSFSFPSFLCSSSSVQLPTPPSRVSFFPFPNFDSCFFLCLCVIFQSVREGFSIGFVGGRLILQSGCFFILLGGILN